MVPPEVPVAALATLVTVRSALVATASVSLAEQTPAVQEGDGLLLVTLTGGEIVAIFVTEVCASAEEEKSMKNSQASMANIVRHAGFFICRIWSDPKGRNASKRRSSLALRTPQLHVVTHEA